jgi:2'-5' RNA ligase
MANHDGASPPRGAEPLRLFFAAWPPDDAAQALHDWACAAADCGERVLPAENLHLTLAFLGATPVQRLSAAIRAARRVALTPRAVLIERTGYWPRGRIVWAGPAETPAELQALAANLADQLTTSGFTLEERTFTPHVTLIRNARKSRELPPLPALEWPITEFVLARSTPSKTGSRYEIVKRFGK